MEITNRAYRITCEELDRDLQAIEGFEAIAATIFELWLDEDNRWYIATLDFEGSYTIAPLPRATARAIWWSKDSKDHSINHHDGHTYHTWMYYRN